jgi:hypothetical protein
MTAGRSLFPVEIQGANSDLRRNTHRFRLRRRGHQNPLHCPYRARSSKSRLRAFTTAPVAGLAISNSEERSAKASFAATGRPPSPYEGVGMQAAYDTWNAERQEDVSKIPTLRVKAA